MVNNVDWRLRCSFKECPIYRHNSRLTDVVPFDDDVTKLCLYNCKGTTAMVHFNRSYHLSSLYCLLQVSFWYIYDTDICSLFFLRRNPYNPFFSVITRSKIPWKSGSINWLFINIASSNRRRSPHSSVRFPDLQTFLVSSLELPYTCGTT